jgi:hypothetical protein
LPVPLLVFVLVLLRKKELCIPGLEDACAYSRSGGMLDKKRPTEVRSKNRVAVMILILLLFFEKSILTRVDVPQLSHLSV